MLGEGDVFEIYGKNFILSGLNLFCEYYVTQWDKDDANTVLQPPLYVLTEPAIVVSNWGLVCVIPEDVTDLAYQRDEDTAEEGTCGLESNDGIALIEVHLVGSYLSNTAPWDYRYNASTCELYHCYPGTECPNGGTCNSNGECECSAGYCGEQCQFEEDICEPLDAFEQFAVLINENFYAPTGSDVEGFLAVGGNATLGSYSVGDKMPPVPESDYYIKFGRNVTDHNALVVGDKLVFTSGRIYGGGNVVYTNPASTIAPNVASIDYPGLAIQTTTANLPVDFDAVKTKMRAMSDFLASLPRTGTAVMTWTTLDLVGTRSDVNVFRISSTDLDGARTINLNLPNRDANTTVIINVMYEHEYTGYGPDPNNIPDSAKTPATNIVYASKGMFGVFDDIPYLSRVIWNFPFATTISMYSIGARGALLAPDAHLNFPTGVIWGQVMANSFAGQGQFNLPMFDAPCPSDWEELLEDVEEGMEGAPDLPDCGRLGSLNVNNTCECVDPTWIRGAECNELCTDFCHNRGMCDPTNSSRCDCWDPVAWTGDRCELSTCGPRGYVSGRVEQIVDNKVVIVPQCSCIPGWTGEDCMQPLVCIHGVMLEDKCQCAPGWSGVRCDVPFPNEIPCFYGQVVYEEAVPVCDCFDEWGGTACDVYQGRGSEFCYFGVYNQTGGACDCDPFWAGEKCDVYTCLYGTVVDAPENEGALAPVTARALATTTTAKSVNACPGTLVLIAVLIAVLPATGMAQCAPMKPLPKPLSVLLA